MKKNIGLWLAAAGFFLAVWGTFYLRSGMDAAEVVRKLAGLRMALTLYTMEYKRAPAAFEDVIKTGKLEEAPSLKLAWHLKYASVRDSREFGIKDTGGWAYVNDPKSPDLGLVFIDCSHKDEKGRFWSEF